MDESDFSDNQEEGEEGEEEVLDPNNPEHAFAIIERDFTKTLTDIEQTPETAQYAEDFTKLFEAFYDAYTKQKDLETQRETLEKMVEDTEEILDANMKTSEEDKKTIDQLTEDITHARKLTDAAHAREQAAQEVIDNLRKQVENLNAEIEFKNKMSQDIDDMGDISKHKDGLERERDKLLNEVTQLTTKLNNAMGYQEELERKNSEADLRINEVAAQIEDLNTEIARNKRMKEKLELEISELTFKIEDRDVQINDLTTVIALHTKHIFRLEQEIKDARTVHERTIKEFEQVNFKLAKLQDDYNNALFEQDKSKKMVEAKIIDVKLAEDEASRLKIELAKMSKNKDLVEKKVMILNSEKDELQLDKMNLRQRIAIFEKEMDDYKRRADEDKRGIETIVKEKEVFKKTIQRQQVAANDQLKLIQIQDQSKKKMQIELDTFYVENAKQKKQIHELARDRDRLAEGQLELTKTIEDYLDEIKLKKDHIFELKKNITEYEIKYRQQQNVYEAIRSDRNSLQKSLQESTAECGELKKKLKIAFHQTEQLKEDIAMKEKLLIKDENIMRKITKEVENLKIEVMTGLDQIRSLKAEIKELKDEEKRLHKVIMNHEFTIRDQATDLEQLQKDRDILGSQLVRRNDEIALLQEKIKILQSTLSRGETQYDQRLEDIKLLKTEIKRLRQEKILISKQSSSMINLKQEIFHLERDLTKSRMKCKALEQEVQNPLNIHRWRKLEGSDPEVLDLLQKIKILQKRLLRQASDGIERERQLKEAERLYLNLRQVVSKQPGPALQEELIKTQRALKIRGDKLKCLVSELNMSELKTAEYKSELQRVIEELTDLKKKFIAEKKANRPKRMASESNREISASAGSAGEVKFTGGGFRMSVQQISSK